MILPVSLRRTATSQSLRAKGARDPYGTIKGPLYIGADCQPGAGYAGNALDM